MFRKKHIVDVVSLPCSLGVLAFTLCQNLSFQLHPFLNSEVPPYHLSPHLWQQWTVQLTCCNMVTSACGKPQSCSTVNPPELVHSVLSALGEQLCPERSQIICTVLQTCKCVFLGKSHSPQASKSYTYIKGRENVKNMQGILLMFR